MHHICGPAEKQLTNSESPYFGSLSGCSQHPQTQQAHGHALAVKEFDDCCEEHLLELGEIEAIAVASNVEPRAKGVAKAAV